MKTNTNRYVSVLVTAFIGLLATTTANATLIDCQDTTLNYIQIDDAQVASCVDSGTGNIGNAGNDDFLNGGGTAAGYTLIANEIGGWTQTGSTGTWDISGMGTGVDAIGFKFGTGNQPDEWFIFDLIDGVLSGDWAFINTFEKGEGLSHMVAYDKDGDYEVPEPGMVALLAIGLLGMVAARRRTKV